MRDDEFVRWLPAMRESYAEGMMRDGGLRSEAAAAKAKHDLDFLFPDGVCPDEQSVYVLDVDGERVGELWIGERDDESGRGLWVFDVEVAHEYRRRGFGKQAMLFVEDEARRRGIERVALNVFGGNEAARDLYRSLGYEEGAVSMSKAV